MNPISAVLTQGIGPWGSVNHMVVIGYLIVPASPAVLHYTVPEQACHYTVPEQACHYTVPEQACHYTVRGDA